MSGDWMRCSVTGLLFRLIISFHVFSAPQPPPPYASSQFPNTIQAVLCLNFSFESSDFDQYLGLADDDCPL